MQTIFKFFLLLSLLVSAFPAFSQNPELQVLTQNEMDGQNRNIQKFIKKCKCYSKKDSIRLFTIYQLSIKDTISKEEYKDGSFLQKLTHTGYSYFYKNRPNVSYSNYLNKDSLIHAFYFLCSRDKKCIAFFDNNSRRFVCVNNKSESYYAKLRVELINSIWEMKNPFVFTIKEKASGDFYFIVNELFEVFVFYFDKDDKIIKILTMKEFIDNYWWKFSNENSRKTIGCRT